MTGGLFGPEEEQEESVFKYAISRINLDPNLLGKSRLHPQIEKISKNDSFHADKKGE